MKRITLLLFLMASLNAFAQNETLSKADLEKELQPLKTTVQTLQKENSKLKTEVINLKKQLSTVNNSVGNLQLQIKTNNNAIFETANELGVKISATENNTNNKISEVGKSLSENSLYGIIAILCAVLLSGLIYWLLSKRQQTDKTVLDDKLEIKTSTLKNDVFSEIEKTKNELQQENIKLDLKLIEVLENQLQNNKIESTKESSNEQPSVDHSIPLKVADEITRINAYANKLDPDSQDAKALKSSVKRLINTFKASQYDIIDLLGQKYDDGMKVTVINEFDDSKFNKDERIIVRIIKPLVKYKGEQIQAAQVDVANGI